MRKRERLCIGVCAGHGRFYFFGTGGTKRGGGREGVLCFIVSGGERKLKDPRDKVMRAFIKKACGYKSKEEVRELRQVRGKDGENRNEMVLTKVVSRDVPADLAAVKWYLEGCGTQEQELTLEEAQRILDE